jgi:hypothetical protein
MIKDAVKIMLDKGIAEETLYDFALATHIFFRESSGTVKDNKEKLLKTFKAAFDEFDREEDESIHHAIDSVFNKLKKTVDDVVRNAKGRR